MSKLIIEDFFLDTIKLKAFCDLKIKPLKPVIKFEKGKVVCDRIEFDLTSQYSQNEYKKLFGKGDLKLSWKLRPLDEPAKLESVAIHDKLKVEINGSKLTFTPDNKEKKFMLNLLEHSLYGEYKLGCQLEHSISYADGADLQLLDNSNMADVKSGIDFVISGKESRVGSKMQISCKLANDSMKELFSTDYRLKVYLQEYVDEKKIDHKDESGKIVIDISEKVAKEGQVTFDWYLGMSMDSSPLDADTMVFAYPRIGKSSLFNYSCVLKLYKLKSTAKNEVFEPYKTVGTVAGDVASLKNIRKPELREFRVEKADEKRTYFDGLKLSGRLVNLANNIAKLNLNFGFYAVDHLGFFHNIKRNELVTVKLDGKDGGFKAEIKASESDRKISLLLQETRTFRYFGAISLANSFILGEGRVRSILNFSSYYRALTDYSGLLSDYKKIIKDSGVEEVLYYGFKADAKSCKAAKDKLVEIMDKGVSWTPDPAKKGDPFTTLMLNSIYYSGNLYSYAKKVKLAAKNNYNYFTGEYGYWHKGANYSYGSLLYTNCKESLQGMVAADIVELFKPEVTDYSKHPVLKVTARGLLALLQSVYLVRYSVSNSSELISFGVTGDMVCSANMSYQSNELLDIPEVEKVLFYGFNEKDKEITKNYYKKLLSDVNEKGFTPEVNKFNLKSTVIMNGIYYLDLLFDWNKSDGKSYYKGATEHIDYYAGKAGYYSSYNISYAQFVYKEARQEFADFVVGDDVPEYNKNDLVTKAATESYTTANVTKDKHGKIIKSWSSLAGVPVKREGFQALVARIFEKITSQ